MSIRRTARKYRRAEPAARRDELIAATLRSLRRHGHAGVSVRHISAEAGVSIGLINHHFPSKVDLIAAAYEALATSLQESIRRRTEPPGGSPRERLSRFFTASFSPEILDPGLFEVWLVFWSMATHTPEIRAVHDRTYGRYRATLESLLGAVARGGEAPPFRKRAAAIALSALLDGLWVELSLEPATFGPREAIALCEDWVAALCAGAFPRLLTVPRRRGRVRTGRR